MGRVHSLGIPADRFSAIFGQKAEVEPGNSRLCKMCGDWHRLDKPWPHNCRKPAPPRGDHAAPQIAPKFEAFRPNMLTDQVINDRREKISYMDEHDLVEYDEGVKPPAEPTEREWAQKFVADIKKAQDFYPGENIAPVDVVGRTDLEGAAEVDVTDIEVADMGPKA